jgi:hypothetical protein
MIKEGNCKHGMNPRYCALCRHYTYQDDYVYFPVIVDEEGNERQIMVRGVRNVNVYTGPYVQDGKVKPGRLE